MSQTDSAVQLTMRNGGRYRVALCVEPDSQHTPEFLKIQIANAIGAMSRRSRWQRFASPVDRLTEEQLDYLTSLDGKEKVAWCASVQKNDNEVGIGLARYAGLADETNIAEFAVTVVDAYQAQGVGYELLKRLIGSARNNNFEVLRGYVVKSNRNMLSLCRRFNPDMRVEDGSFVTVDIPLGSNVVSQTK